jgi:hypothetical protein
MKRCLAACIASAVFISAGAEAKTVITFDSGTAGNLIGSDYAADGVTFTNAEYWQCVGGCPPNSFGLFASDPTESGSFTATFSTLQSSVSFYNVSLSAVTATAYNSSNVAVDSLSETVFTMYTLTGPGISYVVFSGLEGSEFGIDDLTFTSGLATPEPETWALMLAGFAGLGGAFRSRRRLSAIS